MSANGIQGNRLGMLPGTVTLAKLKTSFHLVYTCLSTPTTISGTHVDGEFR